MSDMLPDPTVPEHIREQAKQRLRRGPHDEDQTIIYFSTPRRGGKTTIQDELLKRILEQHTTKMSEVPDSKELFEPLVIDTRHHFPEGDD